MTKEIEALSGEIKSFIDKTNEEVSAHGKIGAKNSESLKALEAKIEEVNANLLAAEQKSASSREAAIASAHARASIGAQVVNSEGYAAYKAGAKSTLIDVQGNTIVSAPADNSDLTSAEVASQRLPGAYGADFVRYGILDAISKGTTASNLIEYAQETTSTNGAAAAAEASTLAQSAIEFTLKQAPVQLIGTFLKVSKQTRDDAPAMMSFIDNRLSYFVQRKLENEVINGNGTSPNLSGILDSGNFTAQTFTAATNDDYLGRLRIMLTSLQQSGYEASAFFMNPADIQRIDLQTDTTGIFIGSDPRAFNLPVAWGVPIVASNLVPANTVIAGDWATASSLFMRDNTTVEVFEQDDTNVQSNLVTVRAQVRGAYATFAPSAVVSGDIVTDV
tara:strand:- start:5454 stop:6623 length:1170 start_codon:yes stop_codon:yes gene_type:complete